VELGGRPPTLANLPRLRWVRAVFMEALRLYPPIWILERNLLAPVEAGGWRLETGAQVLISPWILHRLPEYWERPMDFAPQRFLGEPVAGEENPAFLPFGAGARGCIGKPLALLEGQVFLAAIFQAGTVAVVDGTQFEAEAGVSLRPGRDLRINFLPDR
jgi:cytochrome P450